MNPKYKIGEVVIFRDDFHKVEFCNWDAYNEEWSYDLISTLDEECIDNVSEDLLKPTFEPKSEVGQVVVEKLIQQHTVNSLTELIKEVETMTGKKDYDKYPPEVLNILDELTLCKKNITDKL